MIARWLLALLGIAVIGCASFESRDKLISTASFDYDCPKERIEVLFDEHGLDWGRYRLDVCGEQVKYKRTGNVYHKAAVDPVESATK